MPRAAAARLAVVAFALALSGVYADAAAADTFCVAKESPDCTQSFEQLQTALDAANPFRDGRRGSDTVLIGRGEFTGPFCYGANDELQIIGEGASETLLTGPTRPCFPGAPGLSPPAILTLHNLFSGAQRIGLFKVGIHMPAVSNSKGLTLAGALARDVEVRSDPGAVNPTGVTTVGYDASFSSGSITLPVEGSVGIRAVALDTFITRSRITAVTGVLSTSRRISNLRFLPSGLVTIGSSVVTIADGRRPPGTFGFGLLASGLKGASIPDCQGDRSFALFARNVTVYGSGRDDDIGVALVTDSSTAGRAFVSSSILDNVGISAARIGGGGTACMTIASSSFSLASLINEGPGAITCCDPVEGAPEFVSPATGDFRLKPESPMIDRGDALGLGFADYPLDLEGNPRIVDGRIAPGDVECIARRDVGAVEFVPTTLLARLSASSDAITGRPVEFDASGSCDPNPAASLSYRWTFDDGGTAGGARVLHTFTTPGRHEATVEVTSSDGRSATAATSVLVGAAPAPAPPAAPGAGAASTPASAADREAPEVRRLDVLPHAFLALGAGPSMARSRGATVRYRLSEPAKVRFTVERLVRKRTGHCRTEAGRAVTSKHCRRFKRRPGSFTHEGAKDSNKFRFTGRLEGRKLRPGRYRLRASATDPAGNRGRTIRARFRIARR
jgi:hypothetical protein